MAPINVNSQQSEKGSQNSVDNMLNIALSTSVPKTEANLSSGSAEARYYENVDGSPPNRWPFACPGRSDKDLAGETASHYLLQSNEVDQTSIGFEDIDNSSAIDEDNGQTELMDDEQEMAEDDEYVVDDAQDDVEEGDAKAEMNETNDDFVTVDEVGENNADNEADGDTTDTSSSDDVCSFLARLDAETDLPEEADEHCDDDDSGNSNPAIDKGYAWIICLAVFFIQFMFVGYLKSGGVLFVEFQRQFSATSSMTSMIIGLQEGVCSIGSFICISFVLKKATPRTLCLVGSFFCVIGVAGCALCDQIEYLMITHSLCFGFSVSANYATSILVLNQYFVKRRALAVSLATSGTSVGGIVLPLMMRYFFNTYQYTGGMLMIGGVMMHTFVVAMLLIPVENHKRQMVTKPKAPCPQDVEGATVSVTKAKPNSLHRFILQKLRARDEINSSKMTDTRNGSLVTTQSHQSFHNGNASVIKPTIPIVNGKGGLNFDNFNSKLEICEEGVPLKIDTPAYFDFEDNNDDVPNSPTPAPVLLSPLDDIIRWASNGKLPNGIDTNSPFGSLSSHINGSNPSIYLSPDYQNRIRSRVSSMRSGLDSDSNCGSETQHPINRNISKLSSSRQTLSTSFMFHSTTTLHTLADLVTTDLGLHSHLADGDQNSLKSTFQRLREIFSGNPLLRSVSFWLLAVFYFCGCIGHALPQIYIPALAKERGLSDDDGAFFLSVLNILDIPAHLIPGVLITMGVARATRICVVPMFIIGVISHLTFLYNSYESLLCMCILFGLFGGFYFAMQSVIIIEILGMTHFASSIGFYFLVMGLGAAISFPIAGALKDISGSYSASYHYLATMDLIATFILVCLPLARKYDIKRGILKEEGP